MATTIEAEVLRYDRRRDGRLHAHIARDFCTAAAEYLLSSAGPVLIGTGFYIAHTGKPETDGPPGALALATGLERLGRRVELVTDELCAPMMSRVRGDRSLHVLPVGGTEPAKRRARQIIDAAAPGMIIAIERCGTSSEGQFLQFDGTDITPFTGRMEYLFEHGVPSIGIVDGGNEIGIGAIAPIVAQTPGLPDRPCINWGAYGMLAALSKLTRRMLLVEPEEEAEIRDATVAAGAVDGDSGEHIGAVDGYPSELSGLVVARLHRLINV